MRIFCRKQKIKKKVKEIIIAWNQNPPTAELQTPNSALVWACLWGTNRTPSRRSAPLSRTLPAPRSHAADSTTISVINFVSYHLTAQNSSTKLMYRLLPLIGIESARASWGRRFRPNRPLQAWGNFAFLRRRRRLSRRASFPGRQRCFPEIGSCYCWWKREVWRVVELTETAGYVVWLRSWFISRLCCVARCVVQNWNDRQS